MKKLRRTLFSLITATLLLVPQTVVCAEEVEDGLAEECCPFCDGDELTLKEKYEELLVKALTDEKNLLDDGYITKEVYRLQCKPFKKALKKLDRATDEEVLEGYKWILCYFLNETLEEEAAGEEIDEDFLTYILEEMEAYDVEY